MACGSGSVVFEQNSVTRGSSMRISSKTDASLLYGADAEVDTEDVDAREVEPGVRVVDGVVDDVDVEAVDVGVAEVRFE